MLRVYNKYEIWRISQGSELFTCLGLDIPLDWSKKMAYTNNVIR